MPKGPTSKEQAAQRVWQIMRFLKLKNKRAFAEWAGRSQAAVSDWFSGKTPLQLDIALRLKEEKKLTLDWIYAGDDSGQVPTVTKLLADTLIEPEALPRPVDIKDHKRVRRRA